MNIPGHYQRFHRTHLRFALVMLAVALLAGISFQESGRKVLISPEVPAGAHLEFLLTLALVHGHAVLVGVLLPLAFSWMLHLSSALGARPVSQRVLGWTTGLYLPGAVLTVILMLLKGYHLVLGVRHGTHDFALLNERFMFGNHFLRAGAYGLAHGLMGLGLGVLGVALWRNLGERQA
ncbi:hypothetical protein [Mesoterricola silvestris]|uniref:Uncharacterized protein n=1 Tax=Mesoterricola silvestris TaxID=2927979 RepID=A0AA48H3J1_9BACT|nr:hypothetical protein [Mesoterricola silvestris]BDU71253.1 hypothetical protein METEAL_04270 [Mesoterricola silvestris]